MRKREALWRLGLISLPVHNKLNILYSPSQPTGLLLARAEEAETVSTVTTEAPETAEKYAFEAEVHRMLDIVVHSLYQNKDVFLRELISNASDALDKFRYLELTDETYKTDKEIPLEVKIQFDPESRTITIRDTG